MPEKFAYFYKQFYWNTVAGTPIGSDTVYSCFWTTKAEALLYKMVQISHNCKKQPKELLNEGLQAGPSTGKRSSTYHAPLLHLLPFTEG